MRVKGALVNGPEKYVETDLALVVSPAPLKKRKLPFGTRPRRALAAIARVLLPGRRRTMLTSGTGGGKT